MRPAVPADIPAISRLQAQNMREKLVAELEAPLSLSTSSQLNAQNFAQIWKESWENLGADTGLLVAIHKDSAPPPAATSTTPTPPATNSKTEEEIGGFLSFEAVPPIQLAQAPAGERHSFLISNFAVRTDLAAAGHEGRLLAAVTDILRSQGATELYIWAFASDEWTTGFLGKAGFAPGGIRSAFEIDGKKAVQHLWWTTLHSAS